ncbi:MAG: UbiD family decarboxylase [Candidatus Rokubacteria bacterium]|nr:UbiD family decarboxylase [Candidatus Rokubacteria bacterium]
MPYRDLREFTNRLEVEGHLKRVKRQVDWNLEIGHVAKVNEQEGGPALLFENVKDYPGMPVLTSLLTAKERLALALEMDPQMRFLELAKTWVGRIRGKRVPPEWVASGPCKENILKGDAANLFRFPAPWFYPKDGGRYIGTACFLVSRNLETGRINLGTYRVMIIDERRAGIQIIKAKDAEIDLRGYAAKKEPMPVALIIGTDPVLFLCSSTLFPLTESEYDVAGALRDKPIEVVRGETVDLPLPATAEIVIEGEIMPGEVLPEGHFGEYTGYYTGGGDVQREFVKVKAITHRDHPILWATTVGKPITDTHMMMGLNRTASLWNDLEAMKIPGIRAVYGPPAAAGRFLAIISLQQMYHGHSTQVGLAAFATVTGNYGLKTVIVVDEDIDPENMEQVMYALAFRYQPERGTQILKRGRSTPLDPSLEIESRYMTSRVLIDATIPYEWKDKPVPVELDPGMLERVRSQWSEYFQ